MSKVSKPKNIIIISSFSVVFVVLLFIIYTFIIIHNKVQSTCLEVQTENKEDCVNSLLRVVESDNVTFMQKNTAIWVLGQLADKRALPLLQSLYTDEIPEKESLEHTISQYELKKAIRWCESGNITSWMYKDQLYER